MMKSVVDYKKLLRGYNNMNVFILIGLVLTSVGIIIIMISALILTTYWALKTAEEYKHKRENGDE